MAGHRALVVVTSTEKYHSIPRATGLWLGEAVHFYDVLAKAGWQMDFCSPKGGFTPIDPMSLQSDVLSDVDWKYYHDDEFRQKLGNTLKPEQVRAEQYRCIYFTGGHGVMFDFPDNSKLQEISRTIYENKGIIAAVCHGVVALYNIRLSDGTLLIEGKEVTGFSNAEEDAVQLTSHVPFLTQDGMVKRGALYREAKAFSPFVVTAGRLVTGQNPMSAKAVAQTVLALMR